MGKRIAIVGAGAVGGYVGGYFAKNGLDVTLIDPWPAHVEAIRQRGLALSGLTPEESCTVQVPTMHITEVQRLSRERPIDIAIVSVKSYDTEWAATLIRPYLASAGVVVSLQNCINEERIARVVGWGRTLGCVASAISVDLFEPGKIRRTVPMGGTVHTVFRAGEVHGRITARLEEIVAMLQLVDSAKATTNLWGERWSKLCLNGMRNGLSAATGLAGNQVDRDPHLRRFSIHLGGEAVRVGQALGYALVKIGRLEPELLARADSGDQEALAEVEGVLVARANGNARSDLQRPSMGQDMLKGRQTEIEFMNGFIVAKAAEAGLDVPAHARLTKVVREVERGTLRPSPENFAGA